MWRSLEASVRSEDSVAASGALRASCAAAGVNVTSAATTIADSRALRIRLRARLLVAGMGIDIRRCGRDWPWALRPLSGPRATLSSPAGKAHGPVLLGRR